MNENLDIAIKAATKAGEAIMEVYDTGFNVEYKEDKSPLTEADKKANEIINGFLKETQIPIISEENKEVDYTIRKQWKTCWVVDPVDGTKEFIKRNGEFTVNIALVNEGRPILGVIYVPVTKELYFGEVTKKQSFKATLSSHNTPISEVFDEAKQIIPNKLSDRVIRVVGSRSHMNEETSTFINNIKNKGVEVEIVSKGSSLKLCLIAEGKADIYPRFAPTMEWDTAAGQAICEAAGVKVIDHDTKEPLKYNKQNLLNPWFITGNDERYFP